MELIAPRKKTVGTSAFTKGLNATDNVESNLVHQGGHQTRFMQVHANGVHSAAPGSNDLFLFQAPVPRARELPTSGR